MEDMVAAREVVGSLVADQLQRPVCTLGELLPGAVSNAPGLLATKVSAPPIILHHPQSQVTQLGF